MRRPQPEPTMRMYVFVLMAVGVCACSPGASVSERPLGGLGGPSPGGSATALPQQAGLTVGALRQRLLAFADLAMAEVARGTAAAQTADSTPGARAYVQLVQAEVASTSVALAVEPDPEAALQDLMVSIAAQRTAVAAGAPPAVGRAARIAIEQSLVVLENAVWEIGASLYTPVELERLRARLKAWQDRGNGASPTGVVRVADLPSDAGPAISKGLFAPLDEANRQLEESRLLGERFLFLAERLPVITLWQAEALTWELLAAPESRRTLDGLSLMSSTLERLALRVDSLPALLDGQREALLAAFDTREGAARGLMGDAGTLLGDANAVLASGERLAGMSSDLTANMVAALASAERTIAALRDAGAPGGAMSFDVAAYEDALRDFRVASEALSTALERAEGLASTPRGVIDHAAWRAAQLIVLFFLLLAAYRFGPALVARVGR